MNCKDTREQLTGYLLGDLEKTVSDGIRAHLEQCEGCRAAVREIEPTLEMLRDALATSQAPARLSASHRTRVLDASAPPAERVDLWITRRHRGLAVAASIVIVVGFLWMALNHLRSSVPKAAFAPAGWTQSKSEARRSARTVRRRADGHRKKISGDGEGPAAPTEVNGDAPRLGLSFYYDNGAAKGLDTAPGDSVVETESPVKLRGLYASRRAGSSGSAAKAADRSSLESLGYVRTLAPSGPAGDADESLNDLTVSLPAPDEPSDAFRADARDEPMATRSYPVIPHTVERIRELRPDGAETHGDDDFLGMGSAGRPVVGGKVVMRDGVAVREGQAAPDTQELRAGWGLEDSRVETAGVEVKHKEAKADYEEREATLGKLEEIVAAEVLRRAPAPRVTPEDEETGPRFRAEGVNPFHAVTQPAFSTFSIDVDTASYTIARNMMLRGFLPPAEAVRTEEFVNFFDYAYRPPVGDTFAVYAEGAPSRFGHGLHLVKIGIKGRRLGREEQRRAVLTFLVDTSGSMNQPDRLGLVKKSLGMLVDNLAPQDRVAIVQYDSHARLLLEHTAVSEKDKIAAAIEGLQCSGSTNLEEGMARAYGVAAGSFASRGENRVLLLSDGVANLGSAAAEDILAKVASYRKQGITCSVFGFGMGTYDDTMLETLADRGDGVYSFIDSETEARRLFVEELGATLKTIAADVKIQVEFNPRFVKRYRQLGYENRQLRKQDFRDDAVDAGEVGSGQSVTALYELQLAADGGARAADDHLATVRVRYRRIDNGRVEEIERPVRLSAIVPGFDAADARFRLAACVAEFAEILRGSPHAAGGDFEDVAAALRPVALELDLDGRVQELLRLVQGAGGMGRADL